MRCETKGCSVPASSSLSGSLIGGTPNDAPSRPTPATLVDSGLREAPWESGRCSRRAETRDPCGARLRLGANAVLLLVPLRHRTALQAPVLLRMPVLGQRRRHVRRA